MNPKTQAIRWGLWLPIAGFVLFGMLGALFWLTPMGPISTPGSVVMVLLLGYAGISAIVPETVLEVRDDQIFTRSFAPMPLDEIGAFEVRLTQVLIYSRDGAAERFFVCTPIGLKSAPVRAVRRLAEEIGADVVVNPAGWPSRRLNKTSRR